MRKKKIILRAYFRSFSEEGHFSAYSDEYLRLSYSPMRFIYFLEAIDLSLLYSVFNPEDLCQSTR